MRPHSVPLHAGAPTGCRSGSGSAYGLPGVRNDVFVLPLQVLVLRLPINASHKSSIVGSKTQF